MDVQETVNLGRLLREFLFVTLAKCPRRVWAIALFGWIALLTWLAVSQGPQMPPIPFASFFWNFAHAPAYGLLGPLALLCFSRCAGRTDAARTNLGLSLALVLTVGLSHELLQSLTAYRSFSLWDLASDGAGGLALLGLFPLHRHAAPSNMRLLFYSALSLLLCAFPAWADTHRLSF